MATHAPITGAEAADRLAIRELVDAYAHCADTRDAKGQTALFTDDTRFLVFYDVTSAEPSQELHGRDSLAPVFDDLNQYVATMHFNGQSTVSLDGDRATGESYCLAHHLKVGEDGQRTLMVASIRYLDEFVKQNGQWFFAERKLMVNWIDTRPSVSLGAPPSQSEQILNATVCVTFALPSGLIKRDALAAETLGDRWHLIRSGSRPSTTSAAPSLCYESTPG